MPQHFEITLQGFGRHVTNPVKDISDADIKIWMQATDVLNEFLYNTPEVVLLTFDWSEIVACCEETYRISGLSLQALVKYYSSSEAEKSRNPKIKITVTSKNFSNSHIEYFLYQAFLGLNLSCPSSLDFYRTQTADFQINLSATLFDVALLDSDQHGIHIRKDLALAKTWKWLGSVTSPNRQIARSGIERALFGLLNLSTEDAYNPDSLMWLTYILEGLYDTSIGASFNSLKTRAIKVLNIPEKKRKAFSQNLRNFYDVRSAFVHGGLDVEHPLGIDGWDKSCDDYRSTLLEAIGFAMLVAISTIQVMIENNWERLSFDEVWRGCEIKE
jgi:hypothetical protein